MNNIKILPLLLILFVFTSFHSQTISNFRVKTIVIDPGHGGKDPGCVSGNVYEKTINLAISLKLGKEIEDNLKDVNVIYTRTTDQFVELYERAELANKSNANLFICIHCNTSPAGNSYGTETWVMGIHKTEANLEVAKRENSVILLEDDYKKNYDGFDPNSPEAHIIFSLYQNAYLDQSLSLASKVESQFKHNFNRYSRGVKQAGFLVLWKTAMPSILVETGFISNPRERSFLVSDSGQTKISNAIYKAFLDFKKEVENP